MEENKIEELTEEVTKNEQPVKEPKKKCNGGLIVVIVILVIAILGLVGYICYDKGIIFNKKESTENKNTKDDSTKKKDVVRELTVAEEESFTERITEINNNFDIDYPISDVTKIDNQKLLSFASVNAKKDYNNSFPASDVESIIRKYFGNNIKVNHENILCSLDKVPFYDYDSSSKSYKFHENHPGHGGGSSSVPIYYFGVEKATMINDKKVVIDSKIIYGNSRGDTWGPNNCYYKSVQDSLNHTNQILGDYSKEEELELTDDMIKSVKDKLPTTTYTFEKDGDGYFNLISIIIK